MPYYIHGRDLQVVNATNLSSDGLRAAIDEAFDAGKFPPYLQNKDFILGALTVQLNGNGNGPSEFKKDRPRGNLIHGDKSENLDAEFSHIPGDTRKAFVNNYGQSLQSFLPITMLSYLSVAPESQRITSFDEMEDERALFLTSTAEEKRPKEQDQRSAWQLYAWHINSNTQLVQKDPDTEPVEFPHIPGYVVAQYRGTKKGNVLDYYFCSNRLLFNISTQPKFKITKEHIEDAEAEEAFNLAVYFPLKLAIRQLGASEHAIELNNLLDEIDLNLARKSPRKENFDSFREEFKPLFTDLMIKAGPAFKREKTLGYLKMQADDRGMTLALVRKKLATQLDKPMAAILRAFADDYQEEHAAVEKLKEIQQEPYKPPHRKVLLQMSNPNYYDFWIASYIEKVQKIAQSPELAGDKFKDIRKVMELMLEFARLQSLAHQMQYSEQGQKLQDCIDRFYQYWEWNKSPITQGELHELIKTTQHIKTVQYIVPTFDGVSITAIDNLSKQIEPFEADKANAESHENESDREPSQIAQAEIPLPPEKKSWGWLILTGLLVGAAFALPFLGQAFSLVLAAEELLYVGMGVAAIGGAVLQRSSSSSPETSKKWMLGIGVLCIALAVSIPIVGQITAFSFVAMSLLSIACSALATYFLGSSRSKPVDDIPAVPEEVHEAPDLDVESELSLPLTIRVGSEVLRRPDTLYELPDVASARPKLAEEKKEEEEHKDEVRQDVSGGEDLPPRPVTPASMWEISSMSSQSHVSSTGSELASPTSSDVDGEVPAPTTITPLSSGLSDESNEDKTPPSQSSHPSSPKDTLPFEMAPPLPRYAENRHTHFNSQAQEARTLQIEEQLTNQNGAVDPAVPSESASP